MKYCLLKGDTEMKKVLVLVFILLAAFFLCSCSGSESKGYLWYRRLRISIKHLCPMPDYSTPLLVCPWQVSRDINQGNNRDIEGVAESDKPGCLITGIYIQTSRLWHRLIGYYTHWPPTQSGKAGDYICSKGREQLKVVLLSISSLVKHPFNYLIHIIPGYLLEFWYLKPLVRTQIFII